MNLEPKLSTSRTFYLRITTCGINEPQSTVSADILVSSQGRELQQDLTLENCDIGFFVIFRSSLINSKVLRNSEL